MKSARIFGAIAAVILVGCDHQPWDEVIHDRLLALAGPHADDCGRATTDGENRQQSICALDHLQKKQPFIVQYRTAGIDAVTESGFALDSKGKISSVTTFSWGPSAPVGHIDAALCDPKALHEDNGGALVCY